MQKEIKKMEAIIKGAKEDLRALKAANSNTRQRLINITWTAYLAVSWLVFYALVLLGALTLIELVAQL